MFIRNPVESWQGETLGGNDSHWDLNMKHGATGVLNLVMPKSEGVGPMSREEACVEAADRWFQPALIPRNLRQTALSPSIGRASGPWRLCILATASQSKGSQQGLGRVEGRADKI